MANGRQQINLIVESTVTSSQQGGESVAATFARCLVPDDVQRWSDEIYRLIAEGQRTCPPLTKPLDAKRQSERRKIEAQIASLQAKLRELAANM